MTDSRAKGSTRSTNRQPLLRTGRARFWARLLIVVGAVLATAALGLLYPALMEGKALLKANWRYPWALLGLLVVPFVFYRGTYGEDRRTPRLRVGTLEALRRGPSGKRVWFRDVPGIVRSVAVALCVVALARPISTLRPQTANEKGIDIVVVLDLSGSMRSVMENIPADIGRYLSPKPRGIRPTRLDAAKAVIRDFIGRRKTDRIGIVVFGRDAYVLSPPTLDYHLLDQLVSQMEIQLIDPNGTAIGDAVGVAVARLRRSHAESKAVILLTDGDNRGGKISPEYSAHLANVVGARLYTIQIGEGDVAQVQDGRDLFGQPRYVEYKFPVNPKLLKKLASQTGGAMYVASDATSLQASFHDVLDKLEKTQFEASVATYQDLFGSFLLPGVLLLALDALLRSVVLRRFP